MLRMFRRVRRGRSHHQSDAGDSNAADVDRRLPPRAPPGAISSKASAQWWRGAISGAIAGVIAVLVLVGLVTLLARKNTSLPPPMPPIEELEVDQDHKRCPVYNAVTGETTVPSEDAQAKRKVKILPNQEYPIESKGWADRVVKAKEARSREPKGAKPEQIGRAAQLKRFEESGEKTPPLESGGIGAVLTLVDDDVSKPEQLLAVLGWTGWADGVGGMGAEETIEGEAWQEVIMCQDISRRIGSSLDGAEREAWQRALDIGALKTVSCQTPTGDRLAGELSLACAAAEQTSAEWLWVPGAGVASAVANWGPEAGAKVVEELSSVAKTPNGEGVFGLRGWVRNKPPPHPRRRLHAAESTEQPLYSGTIDPWVTSDDDDELPLAGEAAASVQRRRRSLKSFFLRGGAGETPWKFVGGVNLDAAGKKGTGDDEAGVVEVDALTEAAFVRARHLQHACAFISAATAAAAGHGTPDGGRHILRRGLEPAEQGPLESTGGGMPEEANETETAAGEATAVGTTPSPIVGVVNLSAISYVLRRTLGVRSFVKGGVLSWAGGEKPFGNGVASVFDGRGAALGDGEVSVPGSELLPWDCLSPSTSEAVLLAVTGIEDLRSLKPLLKEFQKSKAYDPYLVLSTPSAWAGSPDIERELETVAEGSVVMTKFGVCGTIDLERVTSMASGSQAGARSLEEAWALLLGRLSPVAVIAIQHRSREGFGGDEEAWGGGGVGDTEKERAARRACARAEAQTAFIAMPPGDAAHALWLPRLAPEALASWARPRFSASLITNARPASLARLLGSLKRARLFGDELAVDFYVESSADDETLRLAEAFSSEWGGRGPVQTHFRVLKGGLIRAVTESFYPSDRHHHAFLLEDDVEISPHFYAWAKWATLTYQYGRASDFLRDMYGVSLYTPRVDELSKKRQVYDSNKVIASKTPGVLFSPYLHQLPCSWGAVFYPETWMEYRLYLAARLREDHISVNIDGSRTNNWNTSWKRFFIEMAYQAQYYMLYPNFFNQTSFSTNWLELGEHIKVEVKKTEEDKKGEPTPPPPIPQTKGDKTHLPKDYTVPLMEDSASLTKSLPEVGLPSLGHLPRLDILNRDVRAHRSFH